MPTTSVSQSKSRMVKRNRMGLFRSSGVRNRCASLLFRYQTCLISGVQSIHDYGHGDDRQQHQSQAELRSFHFGSPRGG